jgi:hypothetical protein
MGNPEDDARVVEHLQALSPENYRRQKIQQEIDEIVEMAATSAVPNNILLKELQKLKTALTSYDQYIDTHVEKAMGYIKKTPKTERAKKRRDVQTESLVRAYLQPKQETKPEGFTLASDIKKNNELAKTNPK